MSKALPAERVNGKDPVRSDPAQDLIAIINELLFRNAARFQPPNLDQPVWFKFDDLSLLPQVVQLLVVQRLWLREGYSHGYWGVCGNTKDH